MAECPTTGACTFRVEGTQRRECYAGGVTRLIGPTFFVVDKGKAIRCWALTVTQTRPPLLDVRWTFTDGSGQAVASGTSSEFDDNIVITCVVGGQSTTVRKGCFDSTVRGGPASMSSCTPGVCP
jgi:hypothetical protein